MKKTSANQFEMMITLMEQYGDLNKLSTLPKGKIQSLQRWEEVAEKLNSDSTGDTKTTDKWKKVWSDLKNNTKRKAAKIYRAANGTGGGPALHTKLTALEDRVLAIIGKQAATGLCGVNEAGILQESQPKEYVPQNCTPDPTNQVSKNENTIEELIVLETTPSPQTPALSGIDTTMQDSRVPVPSPSGHTPRRRLSRGSISRKRKRNLTEQATQYFLNSDEEWRQFKIAQHRDKMEREREQVRIRELELQTQREWMALGFRALELLENYLNKK